MSKLNIYKCKKEYVSTYNEIPEEVKTFFEYQKNDYGNVFIDCKKDLENVFGEDEEEQFQIVHKWFKDNNLYEMDITMEE